MSKRRAWTQEDIEKLAGMYDSDTPSSVMAKLLGRSQSAINRQLWRQGLTDPTKRQKAAKAQDRTHLAYTAGRERRRKGGAKIPPSSLSAPQRAWFMAGWHDKDMELGVSILEDAA